MADFPLVVLRLKLLLPYDFTALHLLLRAIISSCVFIPTTSGLASILVANFALLLFR